ncbi:MAG: hypothetical protein Q8P72_05840 [Candidatus Roizmanbacteria bacterium]|nr:hypothetical protein [Candidatus Roizmanbacteria bacterium]
MSLPKVKNKKLINEKAFVKNAEKVRKSFEEEARYLYDKKMKYRNRS